MILLVPILLSIAVCQFGLAVVCVRRYSNSRIPAIALMIVSPLQVLVALLGESVFINLHSPSSFDPVGDGFDGLLMTLFGTVVSAMVAAAISVWMAVSIAPPSDAEGRPGD